MAYWNEYSTISIFLSLNSFVDTEYTKREKFKFGKYASVKGISSKDVGYPPPFLEVFADIDFHSGIFFLCNRSDGRLG